jgi:hypothetical protein
MQIDALLHVIEAYVDFSVKIWYINIEQGAPLSMCLVHCIVLCKACCYN